MKKPKKRKWLYGSMDGKNAVISKDRGDLPAYCTPAPLDKAPTEADIEKFLEIGFESIVVCHDEES